MKTLFKPLDGLEIKKIIVNQFTKWTETLYLLKPYSAFNKCILKIKFEMSAYPADVPVPNTTEFALTFLPKYFSEIEQDFKHYEETVERLELLHKEIGDILELVNPIYIREVNIDAGDTPDKIRIENGLLVLVLDSSGSTTREVPTIINN